MHIGDIVTLSNTGLRCCGTPHYAQRSVMPENFLLREETPWLLLHRLLSWDFGGRVCIGVLKL